MLDIQKLSRLFVDKKLIKLFSISRVRAEVVFRMTAALQSSTSSMYNNTYGPIQLILSFNPFQHGHNPRI